jgi:hypothetical protein
MRLHPALQQPCSGWTRSNLRTCVTDRDTVYAIQPLILQESLSALEKDLDSSLRIGKPEATAHRGATGCFDHNGLTITSTVEGRFMHWKGMKLSDLLEDEDRLVTHLEHLPFQEGRPLVTMVEESTELVEASSDELISRQLLMEKEGEDDGDLPIVEFDAISEDEATVNTGDENDADHEARRARNRARVVRRRRVNERMRSMHRELDARHTLKYLILGCECLLQYVHLSIGFFENFKDCSGNYSIYPRTRSIYFIIWKALKFFFHEVQIFYLDSSCPKITSRVFLRKFWDSSGYIFLG